MGAQRAWAVRSGAITELTAADARRLGRASLSAVILSAAAMLRSPVPGSIGFMLFTFDGLLTLLRGSDDPLSPPFTSAGECNAADGDVGGRG